MTEVDLDLDEGINARSLLSKNYSDVLGSKKYYNYMTMLQGPESSGLNNPNSSDYWDAKLSSEGLPENLPPEGFDEEAHEKHTSAESLGVNNIRQELFHYYALRPAAESSHGVHHEKIAEIKDRAHEFGLTPEEIISIDEDFLHDIEDEVRDIQQEAFGIARELIFDRPMLASNDKDLEKLIEKKLSDSYPDLKRETIQAFVDSVMPKDTLH